MNTIRVTQVWFCDVTKTYKKSDTDTMLNCDYIVSFSPYKSASIDDDGSIHEVFCVMLNNGVGMNVISKNLGVMFHLKRIRL